MPWSEAGPAAEGHEVQNEGRIRLAGGAPTATQRLILVAPAADPLEPGKPSGRINTAMMTNDCGSRTMRRGLTRVELLVILGVIAALVSILVVLLRMKYIRELQMKDAAQLRGIHQSMLVFANDNRGLFPRPSRFKITFDFTPDIPGGAYDWRYDHTAAMYSCIIAQNYFGPELVVSPAEPTDYVRVMGIDGNEYNWDMYDPANGNYWDPSFVMHIDDPTIGANASYAHLTLTCDAVETEWRESLNPKSIILATRGTRNGAGPGDPNHDRSPTTRFFKPYNTWVGNVVHGDNSISAAGNPALVKSIFNRSDNWLSISTSVVETTDGYDVVDVYDPLD